MCEVSTAAVGERRIVVWREHIGLSSVVSHMERRTVLAGAGIALSTVLGGCVSTDDAQNEDAGNGGESSPADSQLEYDTFQPGALRATHNPLNGAIGSLSVFTTADDAVEEIPLDDIDDDLRFDDLADGQEGTAGEFIEETDYTTEALVSVITRWPKSNPSGVEILELKRDADKIVGTAEATGEDPDVGDDAPTFPVTLFRVTVENNRPEMVEITLTDGSGNEDTIDAQVKGRTRSLTIKY